MNNRSVCVINLIERVRSAPDERVRTLDRHPATTKNDAIRSWYACLTNLVVIPREDCTRHTRGYSVRAPIDDYRCVACTIDAVTIACHNCREYTVREVVVARHDECVIIRRTIAVAR